MVKFNRFSGGFVGMLAVAAMFVAGLTVVASPVEASPGVAKDEDAADVRERPDSVSAMQVARVSGERVEDLSQRDEFSRVYANPDGTWTAESGSGPESVRDAEGVWHEVDLSLADAADGRLASAYSVTDLSFSGGGDRLLARMTVKGKDVAWKWPTVLPEPVVEEARATYPGAVEGGDLVVTATGEGFSYDIVLNQRPTQPVEFAMPVLADGGDVAETPAGGVLIKSAAGKHLVTGSSPVMWDASVEDPRTSDEPAPAGAVLPVDLAVEAAPNGVQSLVLSPDAGFLADPATVYPVTVDPTFTTFVSGDAWVQNRDYTTGQYSSDELRVGTYDSGTHKSRALIHFDSGNSKWAGKKILRADLVLRNFSSTTCNAGLVRVNRVTETWRGETLTWANQPTATSTGSVEYSRAYGATGCAANDAIWNIASIVQVWADNTALNFGLRLNANPETDNDTWRKYRSANYTQYAGLRPHLNVTYNSYPNTAGAPTLLSQNAGWSRTTTPTLAAKVSDPDLGLVAGVFTITRSSDGVLVYAGTSGKVTNGATATLLVPAGKLVDGVRYTVTARASDGSLSSKAASAATTFTVDTSAPVTALTSSAYTPDEWKDSAPADNVFTLDGPSDTASFSVQKDNAAPYTVAANSAGDASVSWNPTSGSHALTVRATDRAGGLEATPQVFRFGVGTASMTSPNENTRSVEVFPLSASSAPGATSAEVQWRFNGQDDWRPATKVAKAGGGAWSGATSDLDGVSSTGSLAWTATGETYTPAGDTGADAEAVALAAPALVQARVCFEYATSSSKCTAPRALQLVSSAFGAGFPTAELGPAQVALSTGEMSLQAGDATDAVAGVGRSFTSYDAATTTPGVFGPGWSTVLTGATGAASATVVDNRALDQSFSLATSDGEESAYVLDPASGKYLPTGDAAGEDHSWMIWQPESAKLTLFEPLGTETTTTRTVWQIADGAGELVSVSVPGKDGDSVTQYDAEGNPVWLGEPHGVGVCTLAEQDPGCRGLKLTYAGSGDEVRVASVQRLVAGQAPATVAAYDYTSAGELRSVCGPDPDPAASGEGKDPLCETYSYAQAGGRTLIESYTPAGQAPWRFGYASTGRLDWVKRERPEGGDATWAVGYDLDREVASGPVMTPEAMASWGQTSELPVKAFAVFEPGDDTGDVSTADLTWVDETDKVTNTATHGPKGWLVETLWRDQRGNITRTLDGAGWARVQQAEPEERPSVASDASSFTRYNTWGEEKVAGTLVVDSYGPATTATLRDGTTGMFRAHTHYVYDNTPDVDPDLIAGRPAEATGGLVVQEESSAAEPDLSADHDRLLTRNDYNPVVEGDGNGWQLGSAVRTRQQDGSGWATWVTRINPAGQVIETRRPGGQVDGTGAGADALSTTTTYYTPDGEGACGGKPAWAGQVCATGPAVQPASGPSIPTTRFVSYTDEGQPAKVVEDSGASTRTTISTYDALGRVVAQSKQLAGAGAAEDGVTNDISYNDQGAVKAVSAAGKTVSTGYDSWGRTTTSTDAVGTVSHTAYTSAGQVASFDDSAATYAYSYGPHGELASVAAGGGVGSFSYAYTRAGQIASVTYPNGMVATRDYTEAGVPVGLDYTQGENAVASFTAETDVAGRTIGQTSTGSSQEFAFDDLGRLTRTRDRRGGECTTRTYGFDAASNRTSFKVFGAGAEGGCQQDAATVDRAHGYDAAGRIQAPGYSYD